MWSLRERNVLSSRRAVCARREALLRNLGWEDLPQEGNWDLINKKKLTGETRQERSSSIIIGY